MSKKVVENYLGSCGRLVGASKGRYRYNNPTNLVVFNANLCTEKEKLWFGDIDLTLESDIIKNIAKELGQKVYVLYESDARFENEEHPKLDQAVLVSDGKTTTLGKTMLEYAERVDGKFTLKERKEVEQEIVPEHYDKKEFPYEIEVADFEVFSSSRKSLCPFELMALFVARNLGVDPKTKKMNPGAIWLRASDEKKLEGVVKAWMKKAHKITDDYEIQRDYSWLNLDIGPMVFRGDPDWTKEGFIYLRKDLFEGS